MNNHTRLPVMLAATLLAACTLAACEPRQATQITTTWATIDTSKVRESIRETVKAQHPYPDHLRYDASELSRKTNALRQQISRIKNDAQTRCTNALPKSSSGQSLIPPPPSAREAWVAYHEQRSVCNNAGDNDPLVLDLQGQAEELDKKQSEKRSFDSRIDATASKAMGDIVGSYAAGRFDLVIGNRSEIAFNQSQVTVDITQAVIEHLQAQSPAFALEAAK